MAADLTGPPRGRQDAAPGEVGEIVVFGPDEYGAAAGRRIQGSLRAAIREGAGADGPAVSLALTGGSTPVPVYEWLAAEGRADWSRVSFYFGDERCVAPDDPASNYGMARRTLLAPLGVPPARVHRMRAERPEPSASAAAYAALLPAPLDVLLLGIGADAHTASLFPGSPALEETRRVVAVEAPAEPPCRLTITPPVIAAARRLLVLATGERKASAVRRALEGEEEARGCPARLARHGTWLLDTAAASELARP